VVESEIASELRFNLNHDFDSTGGLSLLGVAAKPFALASPSQSGSNCM
jgi:hypothetical protein